MATEPKKLVKKPDPMIQSDGLKVISHVQRKQQEWILHTLMCEGIDVPFKFKRPKKYQNLKGAKVNLSYYPATEIIAGMEMEIMKVSRITRG